MTMEKALLTIVYIFGICLGFFCMGVMKKVRPELYVPYAIYATVIILWLLRRNYN